MAGEILGSKTTSSSWLQAGATSVQGGHGQKDETPELPEQNATPVVSTHMASCN